MDLLKTHINAPTPPCEQILCVFMFVFVCACAFVYIYTHIHIYIYTYTYIYNDAFKYVGAQTC